MWYHILKKLIDHIHSVPQCLPRWTALLGLGGWRDRPWFSDQGGPRETVQRSCFVLHPTELPALKHPQSFSCYSLHTECTKSRRVQNSGNGYQSLLWYLFWNLKRDWWQRVWSDEEMLQTWISALVYIHHTISPCFSLTSKVTNCIMTFVKVLLFFCVALRNYLQDVPWVLELKS